MNIASVNMLSLLSCVSLASAVVAGAVPGHYNPVGDLLRERGTFGPISTNSADGIAGGQVACDAAPVGSFFAGLKPPFPTNSWWAPYAAPPGNATAAGPFPYESSLDGSGVLFGISTSRQFDGTSVKQPTQVDWHASFAEHNGAFANHKATSFDTQTVTVQYFQNGASMDTYLVPGSPYMTFKYTAATPLLTSGNGGIKALNGKTLAVGDSSKWSFNLPPGRFCANCGIATATGTTFTVTDTKGTVYLIYALSSITLTAKSDSFSSGTIRASGKFDGVLRLVMLANQSHKTLLDQHYKTYPTAASLDYSFGNVDGTVIFNWDTQGDGAQLLMLTWPHHRLTMQNPSFPPTSALGYLTTKGWMYPAIGNLWRMKYALSDITWNAPRPLDNSCADGVRNGLEYEVSQLNVSNAPVPGDFYYWGNTMAAQARLALIADEMGRHDLVDKVVSYLKASFEHWFQSSSSTLPAYETGWGGIINKAGYNNAYVDFGNGYYNDHHFHYGYFLNVAAVIAKYNNAWLNQHRDYINLFARDIINPSPQDPYFPVTRCRDWFAGHSWASGIANGAGSRDQESSGEAINGYYGALLWASVALSQDYVNYAKLLLASEQLAAGVYWHLDPQAGRDDRDNPYPEPEMRKLVSMGNVMDYQSGAWLFWGSQKVEIAAIQILPLTPTNEVLYDSKWVQNVWNYTMPELVDPSIGDEWKCVIIAAYANKDPQTAAEWSSKLTTWGSGNTYTNELYFIGTRPNASGRPICGALPQNPYGTFKIQSASSSKYVGASSSSPDLVASGTDAGGASTFTSAYLPNAGTLQLVSSNQYVTADQSGNSTLAAARATASAWERFVVRQKVNAATGVYTIKAASNGKYVTLAGDGSLVNSAAAESAGEGFRFIKA